jgi:sodium transport system permease protein
MRAAFREKTIVINSILIPIFLYPFLLWAAFSGILFVMGQTKGFVSRVAITEWPREHPRLRLNLQRDSQFEITEFHKGSSAAEREIRTGQLDALLTFLAPTNGAAALRNNFQAHITFDQSRERSTEARNRLTQAIEDYRADWLKRDAARLGVNAAAWQGFTISSANVASKKQMGTFLLGLLAPIIFVVMVAVGCFYPAVDALAGERERNTWETLISTATPRLSIVISKYLYVVSLGGLAGILNIMAVFLTIKPIFGPLLEKTGGSLVFTLPVMALPFVVIAAILLAGFIAAGMMLFAAFARTFKEGHAMTTPFYMLIMLPVMFLQVPGLKLTLPLAFVPIVNVTMMVREVISGTFQWKELGITVIASLLVIAIFLRLATYVLEFEDVLVGSYNGSFWKFLRQRLLHRSV